MLLEVKDLNVCYGRAKAIEEVSFSVAEGEIVAMVGPNGAGKSTALKAVSGVLPAADGRIDSGDVFFDGRTVKGLRTDELAAKGISLVPEGRRVFSSMTALENLEMGAFLIRDKGRIQESLDRVLALFEPLRGRLRQKAGTLSSGEQQMLAFGRALMLQPRLLLADEPSLGLSPNFVEMVFAKIQEINKAGTSILLVEQNAQMALDVCHRGYVFETGRIALAGTRDDLLKNTRIRAVFLGG